MLQRDGLIREIRGLLRAGPVIALIGPRQCGKTTVAREFLAPGQPNYFDLEDPVAITRLAEPMTALRSLRGLVVIDEVQRRPDLFPVLRVLADRRPLPARFLILGSASPDLLQQGSETLAGRISFIEMSGFSISEAGPEMTRRLWWRGGFPRSFLARSEQESVRWRQNFMRTFLERDIRELGVQVPPIALRRLWMMLAHYHGQTGNASEIARSLGESHSTVKRHVDLLTGSLMIRQLQPWHANLSKRQVKSPKFYVRDSGLLHTLLGVETLAALEGHPKLGASWEGFVVEEAVRAAGEANSFFWATQSGAELDLLVLRGESRIGIEVKYGDAPSITKSMRIAGEDLQLDRMIVVYPGEEAYSAGRGVRVIPPSHLAAELAGKTAGRRPKP
jgi:predicted AAA+ superfamily ATPase